MFFLALEHFDSAESFIFARSAYYFRTGPFEKISLSGVLRFREFYRGGKRVATEASLAWYFDRKNVRTTFQVRKVTLN